MLKGWHRCSHRENPATAARDTKPYPSWSTPPDRTRRDEDWDDWVNVPSARVSAAEDHIAEFGYKDWTILPFPAPAPASKYRRSTKPRDAETLDLYLDFLRRRSSSSAGAGAGRGPPLPSEQMLRGLRELAEELDAQNKHDYPAAMKKVFGPEAADHQLVFDPHAGRLWTEPRMLEDARRAWHVRGRNVGLTSARGCRSALEILERGERGVESEKEKGAAMDAHSPDDVD
ncbi:hypothetical protein F4811DRAFT_538026 [Daldinia bambusicola]|nr:hypothetical protein F4811DRAFT_538026 [Daldinia bambusicola]